MHRFAASLIAAGFALAPSVASACGGFFCSSAPVDQQAERILFAHEEGGAWSVYVEILYQGEAQDFAWVVPVPEAPQLDTWHKVAFDAIDQATAPNYQPDQNCFGPEFAAGGADGDPAPNARDADEDGEVQVLAREQVGPFDTATVESRDPRALVEWLRTNGFRIVPEMEPFIALYTAEGFAFTAMKLQPGEGVEEIKPIKMTYNTAAPVVPLRLTAVAAMPEMGVKVWVLDDKRYGAANVPNIEIPLEEVVFDWNSWSTNYIPLVARKVDEAGGHGFVTEYAQPTAALAEMIENMRVPQRGPDDDSFEERLASRDDLARLLRANPYLTRLYTRVSPEEMDLDPLFEKVEGEDVSNFHQLPPAEDQDQCNQGMPAADACEFAACGASGRCAAPEENVAGVGHLNQSGCACAEGSVARVIPGIQNGRGVEAFPSVSCVDARLNFASPSINVGQLALADPCTANPCGEHGECVSLNGAPTCRCEQGFIATVKMPEAGLAGEPPTGMVEPTCVAPLEAVPPMFYATTALREPALPYPGKVKPPTGGSVGGSDSGCSATGSTTGSLWFILLGAPLLLRRRRH